jgi:predicted metalloprotease with PDZ domain
MDVNIGREGADCKLSAVHDGGAAQKAGLSANDLLVAIDGLRVSGNPANVDSLLARYRVGDTVQVHAFRRDELMAFDVTLQGDRVPGITIAVEQQKTSLRRPTA